MGVKKIFHIYKFSMNPSFFMHMNTDVHNHKYNLICLYRKKPRSIPNRNKKIKRIRIDLVKVRNITKKIMQFVMLYWKISYLH